MDSSEKSIEVRSQKSEVRSQKRESERRFWLPAVRGVLASLLFLLLFSPGLRAQTADLCQGDLNCGKLGDFINPPKVTVTGPVDCNYDALLIDMSNGKVWVRPIVQSTAFACPVSYNTFTDTLLTLADLFSGTSLPTSFPDGVFEVGTFTLQRSIVGTATANVTLSFLPNADNTPVWIRATGNVAINVGQVLSVAGKDGGGVLSTFLGGDAGAGGPGGYRGGDGGSGGVAPTPGSAGFGPGGGAGGAVDAHATDSPEPLTTGKTVAGTVIPSTGADLMTMMRGGAGGGGGGGRTNAGADGGGGGGGAILIAAQGTLTVNGTVTATGGISPRSCCRHGSGGAGGFIRLVANTIAGGGTINVSGGAAQANDIGGTAPAAGQAGLARLEAYNITFNGTLGGNVGAARAPGQIILPTTPTAFLRIAKITDTSNGANTVTLDTSIAGRQAASGRTGLITGVDVTMPNPTTSAATVNVDFTVGPCPAFPAGKHITLAVTPLDSAQGAAKSYTTDSTNPNINGTTVFFTAGSTAIDCTATPDASIKNVALPLGISSLSAFAVLSLDTGGALARMFPKTFQGEEIESVRIEASERGTEYVLIAKSGREFPYRPAR